mmetsp:Transcript_44567/g.90032  ORF Transcript_44567/g.90032 Transcript_44567/m.90032 type:complete len:494 (-) Transcript_44567:100-1581(-)
METLKLLPRWTGGYHQIGWVPADIPIFETALLFTIVVFVWEFYLDYRQSSRLSTMGGVVPGDLAALVKRLDDEAVKRSKTQPSKETAADSTADKKEEDKKIEDGKILETMTKEAPKFQAYGIDKMSFGMVKSLWGLLFDNGLLLLGLFPYLWDMAVVVGEYFGYTDPVAAEIPISIIFLGLQTAMDTVLSTPWSLYSTFVVEEKHGFNKTTAKLFVSDLLMGLALSAVIGVPAIWAVLKIIKWGGDYFFVFVWLFLLAFSIFFLTVYPVLIQPLFNKYEPLPEGDLKDAIFALAAKLKFPLTKLFVVDGSKRSSHSNAYLYGFFNNKRIVLFDTLVKQMTVPELEAVLGHEIGHWANGHVMQMFAVQQAYFFAMFMLFGLFVNEPQLYLAFGFNPTVKPTIVGLLVFLSTVWAPVDKLLGFLVTLNTRKNEFEADQYSVDLDYGPLLKMGLTKMSIENRSNLDPDPLYSLYHYSHPPLLQRLSAIDDGMKKKK